MAINHQPYMKMEHEHHHYRLMEQQQKQQDADQMYVLDLSLKNKHNKMNDDVEASMSRDMEDDDDVKMKSTNHHPLQSLLSMNGINKQPLYTSNDMTMFWNMLMHFSFNNYNNYFKQQFKDTSESFDGLKGWY